MSCGWWRRGWLFNPMPHVIHSDLHSWRTQKVSRLIAVLVWIMSKDRYFSSNKLLLADRFAVYRIYLLIYFLSCNYLNYGLLQHLSLEGKAFMHLTKGLLIFDLPKTYVTPVWRQAHRHPCNMCSALREADQGQEHWWPRSLDVMDAGISVLTSLLWVSLPWLRDTSIANDRKREIVSDGGPMRARQ